jgi:ATP-dependent protease ClpP protease subunit
MADVLDELDGTIAQMYADRSGRPPAEYAAAMAAETWYTSAQAVAAGLADRVANDRAPAPVEDRASQLIRARARIALGRGQQ